ncbi:glycerate kinase [Vallitalea pronyensis]|uniref:Glycerate kinase n=1 Tax=Vallitalea pronyensis TaxID=1348613 RepID=A0A8J8MLY3_9FIRM|nr:glycerate kinase [Vallitalea pronyensis]QUI24185.1 glycerate kinase [Vallitalea pronyensis]
MNIFVAPDSFKGSVSAIRYCEIAKKAILNIYPEATIVTCPLADGGEGTVEALVHNTQGTIEHTNVTGPLGETVDAKYGILGDNITAVIEMASASGLPLVPDNQRNPLYTTTYGTGELIKAVLDKGCTKIILGIGGSATNDGGAGMLEALGFRLLDKHGTVIGRGAIGLKDLHTIDMSACDARLQNVEFLVACDVNNPLCGKQGASYIYGPQKGALQEDLPRLDSYLEHYAQMIQSELGKDVKDVPGAGAAGGLGAGLLAFMDASLQPGFDIIRDSISLDQYFHDYDFDLVITGEGEINYQTVHGKLPVGVATVAKKYHVPVIGVVGSIGKDAHLVYEKGIDTLFSIVDGPRDLTYAMEHGEELLYQTIERVMRLLASMHK